MEADERPAKIRKLSHHHAIDALKTLAPVDADQDDQQVTDELAGSQNEKSSGDKNAVGAISDLPKPESFAPLASTVSNGNGADPPLSKSQQKKLKRKAEWEAKREDRKAERKVKLQAKRERKREAKQQAIEQGIPLPTPIKAAFKRAIQLPITIMIDCNFDDLMHEGERTSLASQVTRSYSDNKNAPFRAHLTICSFGGKLRERFETVLAGQFKAWKGVRTFDSGFVETAEMAKEWMSGEHGGRLESVFSKYQNLGEENLQKLKNDGEVVYLSSEGSEDLLELKPYSTYIIGGLVDKNREKGICHRRATQAGVKTARLPIGQYMDMASRKVLATNHVNEILVKWLECGDWGEAFFKVMPKRKGGKLKNVNGADGDDEQEAHSAGSHERKDDESDEQEDESQGEKDELEGHQHSDRDDGVAGD